MAWNGSNGSAMSAKPVKKTRAPSALRGLVAGVVVVAVAAIGLFFALSGRKNEAKPVTMDLNPGRIVEVEPAPAPKAVEVAEEKKPKHVIEIKTLPDGRLMKYRDGKPAWLYPRKPLSAHPITNGLNRVKTFEEKVFKNPADVEIAWLLNTEYGESLVGDYDYHRAKFEKKFLEAMKEDIVIAPEDDEATRSLKEGVIAARKDLMQRYRQGEDIAKIMSDTRKELQEIGMYRDELAAEVRKIMKDDKDGKLGEQDAEDLLSAANKMLEERGAKPIAMPAFFKYKMMKRKSEVQ